MTRLALALLILLPLAIRLWDLDAPLTERHQFRQSQTALTVWTFQQQGIDLLGYETPLFGPPWQVPMEFPLFQAGAALLGGLGMSLEMACRVGGLLAFLLALAGLWGVLRVWNTTPAQRNTALLALWAMPLAVVWSRACTIEYLAAAAALGQLAALLALAREARSPWVLVAGVLSGSVAGLVKITTLVPYLAVAAVDLALRARGGARVPWLRVAVVAGVPIAVAMLWTAHADAIKAASPQTAWLTSAALTEWNLGTLAQRFDPEVWWTLLRRIGSQVLPFAWVLPVLACAPRVLAPLAGILAAWLVLTNLYATHDYYAAAITPLAALALGMAWPGWWSRIAPRTRPWIVLLLVASTLGGWRYVRSSLRADPGTAWRLGRIAAAHSQPDEWILVRGFDWDPTVLYAARRRGILLRENVAAALATAGWQLARDPRARVLVTTDPDDPLLALHGGARRVATDGTAAVWVLR